MSSSIPFLFVDEDEFQALEVAIAAAEFSVLSSKKPKLLPPQTASLSSNLRTHGVSAVPTSANKLECSSSALTAEKGTSCAPCFHGAAKEAQSPESVGGDGGEFLDSSSRSALVADARGGSCSGVSVEEACVKPARLADIARADGASFQLSDAGKACADPFDTSTGVLIDSAKACADEGKACGYTFDSSTGVPVDSYDAEKRDPCSFHEGTSHEDILRQPVSSRRLPTWTCSSQKRRHENSRPSRHAGNTSTSRHVNNQIMNTPQDSCAENYHLPWGLAPHTLTTKHKLPSFQFKGQIIYSDTIVDAENAANELLRQVEAMKTANHGSIPIGFDAEWKVSFERGYQRRKVAVVQLCINSDKCNVFHVIHSGIPSSLKSILEDPLVSKVGVGAFGDAEKLFLDYSVNVKGVKDLSALANLKRIGCTTKNWSLSSLAVELLGKKVDKNPSIRMGDWEVKGLSDPQLQYAATDAFASLYLFQVLATFPDP